jgi:peptide/nickel transport system ATP-binding protein
MVKQESLPLLSVKNLSVFLTRAKERIALVDRISFELKRGTTTALVGESGSGKSLTAQALMGLINYHCHLEVEGSILLENQEIINAPASIWRKIRGHRLAYISQNPMQALNPVLTIGQQLIETALHHITQDEEEAYFKSIETLKKVHLSEPEQRMNDYPHQLSGGMRQRALIAMALLTHPDILIADEPTTALDLSVQRQILDLFHEIQKKQQTAILLISHDISIVSHYADDVIVMYASQIVEKGPCLELLQEPKHPYTQGLLASRPRWEKPGQELLPIQGNVPSVGTFISGCHFHPRCPKIHDKCSKKEPDLFTLSPYHLSKCWLHEIT